MLGWFVRKIEVFRGWLVACAAFGLTSCVTVKERVVRDGLFVHTNRAIADPSGQLPDSVAFKKLKNVPRAPFFGRVSREGAKAKRHNNLGAPRMEILTPEEFHGKEKPAAGAENREDDVLTFREAVGGADSIVIYVHGFNNSAGDAAYRAGRIAYRIEQHGRKAAVLCFAWPTNKDYLQVAVGSVLQKVSSGRLDALINDIYLGDRKNIDLAANVFRELIGELKREYPKKPIDIIAHSMGAEVVLKSFFQIHYDMLANDLGDSPPIRHVAFIGADVGVDAFRVLVRPCEKVTRQLLIYLNPADDILGFAAELNQDDRLGTQRADTPLPDLDQEINFVRIEGQLTTTKWIVRSIIVNHNPMTNSRVMKHICRFLETGEVEMEDDRFKVERLDSAAFRGTRANYFRLILPKRD